MAIFATIPPPDTYRIMTKKGRFCTKKGGQAPPYAHKNARKIGFNRLLMRGKAIKSVQKSAQNLFFRLFLREKQAYETVEQNVGLSLREL